MGTVNLRRVSKLPVRAYRLVLLSALAAAVPSCREADEAEAHSLSVVEPVAYWSVRGKNGDSTYIRPVVRFRLHNNSERPIRYVQTMAVFRREKTPTESWGSAFEYSVSGEPIPPGGGSDVITLRADSNYFSKDSPEKMFESKEWEQVNVEIYVKVKAAQWSSLTRLDVPKHIGPPGVESFQAPPSQ